MKEVRIAKTFIAGEIAIIPLERVGIRQYSAEEGFFVYVFKEPAGIVIDSPQGRWAIDVYGEQVPLETYIREVDGLQKVLDSLQDQRESE